MRKKTGRLALGLAVAALLLTTTAAAQGSKRIVRGQVLDDKGEAVATAVVHLKNKRSGETISVATNQEGRYQFNDVEMKEDFELHAESKGQKSRSRTISQFDTRPIAVYNLQLEPPDDTAQEKDRKEEEKN